MAAIRRGSIPYMAVVKQSEHSRNNISHDETCEEYSSKLLQMIVVCSKASVPGVGAVLMVKPSEHDLLSQQLNSFWSQVSSLGPLPSCLLFESPLVVW